MLKEKIQQDLIIAIKQNRPEARDTLRLLNNNLALAEKEKRKSLNEQEETEVLKKAAKQRKESIEAFEKADRNELAEKEKKELEIIQKYLPEELSDEEIEKIVQEKIVQLDANDPSQTGKIIGAVMAEIKGKAGGGRVATIVKKNLTNQ